MALQPSNPQPSLGAQSRAGAFFVRSNPLRWHIPALAHLRRHLGYHGDCHIKADQAECGEEPKPAPIVHKRSSATIEETRPRGERKPGSLIASANEVTLGGVAKLACRQ